jgi:uncharacterized protein YciI
MFHLVISRYLKSFDELDAAMAEHQAFLETHYRQGSFLLSGPKLPRDGGVILAQTASREELIGIMENDPLRVQGLIDYDVVGWNLNRRASELPEQTFPGSRTAFPLADEGAPR